MSKVNEQVRGIRFEFLLALVFVAVTLGSVFAELRGLQAYVSGSVWFHAIVIGALIQPNFTFLSEKYFNRHHSLRLLIGFLLVLVWAVIAVVVLQEAITASVTGFLQPHYITVANATLLLCEYGLYSYPIIHRRTL